MVEEHTFLPFLISALADGAWLRSHLRPSKAVLQSGFSLSGTHISPHAGDAPVVEPSPSLEGGAPKKQLLQPLDKDFRERIGHQ